ncbi:hypothetical protein [Dyadobacter sp. 676]|uniref:Uncharacterized protein n=1 Tax=Dyadobacter sp. 676 TaxID=3088362 RepID=A0AAU8FP51_9BACT
MQIPFQPRSLGKEHAELPVTGSSGGLASNLAPEQLHRSRTTIRPI